MKSVIKGRYKANVGAGAGSGTETFWKLEPEPERKQKVSASQHCFKGDFFINLNSAEAMNRGDEEFNASSLQFLTQRWMLHRRYF